MSAAASESRGRLSFHRTLRFRVPLAIFLSIMLIASLTSLVLYRYVDQQRAQVSRKNLDTFAAMFEDELRLRSRDLELALELLLSDETVSRSFARRDREALIDRLLPIYETRLRPVHEITQLHFHEPPATSFLRLHRLERFGDDLSPWRQSLVDVNSNQRPVTGLEVTRSGPGLKVVYPVEVDAAHVGSVEFATTISTLLRSVSSALDLDYALGVVPEVWDQARCGDLLTPLLTTSRMIYYEISNPDLAEVLNSAGGVGELRIVGTAAGSRAVDSFRLMDFRGRYVGVVTLMDDVSSELQLLRMQFLKIEMFIAGLALFFAALISVFLRRSLFRPLDESDRLAQEVARGNFASKLAGRDSDGNPEASDEISRLVRSLHQALEYLRTMAEIANKIAAGRLAIEVKPRSAADAFGQAFGKMLVNLRATMVDIKTASQRLSASTAQIRAVSQQITLGADEQVAASTEASSTVLDMAGQMQSVSGLASDLDRAVEETVQRTSKMGDSMKRVAQSSAEVLPTVEETTETIQEMSAAIRAIAAKSTSANEAAEVARTTAVTSGQELTAILLGIRRATDDIVTVVDIIQDVSSQTNRLAVNASVEAARAGEAGKGFAVVAQEIRALATNSRGAAERIVELVESVSERTVEGAELSEAVLSRIRTAVAKISELIAEVATGMRVQSDGSERIIDASSRLSNSVREVDGLLHSHSEDTEEVLAQAQRMLEMTAKVAAAARHQQDAGAVVVRAIKEITRFAHESQEATTELSRATDGLDGEADRLAETATAFDV